MSHKAGFQRGNPVLGSIKTVQLDIIDKLRYASIPPLDIDGIKLANLKSRHAVVTAAAAKVRGASHEVERVLHGLNSLLAVTGGADLHVFLGGGVKIGSLWKRGIGNY